jgi:hypothetical protein
MLRIRRAVLFVLVASVCACETSRASRKGGFKFTGDGIEVAFNKWRATVPRRTRELIDAIDGDETLLIHVFRGKVQGDHRGAQSAYASNEYMLSQCLMHPSSEGIPNKRNWDIIIDSTQMLEADERYHTVTTFDVLLHHEVIGHIVPHLEGRTGTREELEKLANRAENEYRKTAGLPLLPWGAP